MWITFFFAVLIEFVLVLGPGYLALRVLHCGRFESFVYSPLPGIFLMVGSGVLLNLVGIKSNALILTCLSLATVGIAAVFFCKAQRNDAPTLLPGFVCSSKAEFLVYKIKLNKSYLALALYFFVSVIVTMTQFVLPLDGPSSFAQDSDNTFHLSCIMSMATSGNYSLLDVSLYHQYDMGQYSLVDSSGGFYPAVWNLVAALCVSALGCDVPLAANATTFFFLVFVFSLSVFAFMRVVFSAKPQVVIAGAFVFLGFASFPWGLILSVSGPVFPNFVGQILVFLFAAMFIMFMSGKKTISFALLMVCSAISVAVSHPNAVFSLVVLLAPYCVHVLNRHLRNKKCLSDSHRTLVLLGFILLCLAMWITLYFSPFFYSVTHFTWDSTATIQQAIINVLSLAFRLPCAQLILSILVLWGFASLVFDDEHRWLIISYAIAALIYIASASFDGSAKNWLSGFWYTDPYRTGANAACFAIPLAAVGLSRALDFATKFISERFANSVSGDLLVSAKIGLAVLVLLGIYYPSFLIPGYYRVTTAFGDYNRASILANDLARDNLLDPAEKAFCEKVKDIVDPDYVIYNNPDDGSSFAYPLDDLNLAYKRSAAELLGNETPQSELLRNCIDKIAYNASVQEVVSKANIRYVLILDLGGENLPERCYYGYYTIDKWPGPNRIDDNTPGLQVLLSEGDMRLYEITCLN